MVRILCNYLDDSFEQMNISNEISKIYSGSNKNKNNEINNNNNIEYNDKDNKKMLDVSNISRTFENILQDLDNKPERISSYKEEKPERIEKIDKGDKVKKVDKVIDKVNKIEKVVETIDKFKELENYSLEEGDKVPAPIVDDGKVKYIDYKSTSPKNDFNLKLLKKREKEFSNKKVFQLSLENKTEKPSQLSPVKPNNEKAKSKKLLTFEPKLDNQFINDSEHNLSQGNSSIILNKLNKEQIIIHSKSVILTPSKY